MGVPVAMEVSGVGVFSSIPELCGFPEVVILALTLLGKLVEKSRRSRCEMVFVTQSKALFQWQRLEASSEIFAKGSSQESILIRQRESW